MALSSNGDTVRSVRKCAVTRTKMLACPVVPPVKKRQRTGDRDKLYSFKSSPQGHSAKAF